MSIIACGINHKTAPIEIREHFAIADDCAPIILKELINIPAINEAVLLSTCNRTEIYSTLQGQNAIRQWFMKKILPYEHDCSHLCYSHSGKEAVAHAFRVASGLDSMVIGEPQILGQMKKAYLLATQAGSVGTQLKTFFPSVFSASKQIRQQTDIGKNPVTFAYAVVQLLKQIFEQICHCRVLLIGAGETIELMANHLYSQGVRQFVIANRTVEKSVSIADTVAANCIRIGDIPLVLSEIDIVISATASQLPIIGKGLLERTLKNNKRKPLFMADLAMPRDIEPEIAELEDVYLYNIDDLQAIVSQNKKSRQKAAEQAEALIQIQAEHFCRQLHVENVSDMIRHYRSQLEIIRDAELAKAKLKLQKGDDPQLVLEELARSLMNKFMHKPTLKLRQAAYHQQHDYLLMAKQLLDY